MAAETSSGFRLSPQQKHVWALQQREQRQPYRTLAAVRLEGPLNPRRLQAAVQWAITRHEILRTTFHNLAGVVVPVQVVAARSDVAIANRDLIGVEAPQAALDTLFAEMRQHRFAIDQGPLLDLTLVRLATDQHVLLLGLPALNSDMATLMLLVRAICDFYAAGTDQAMAGDEPVQYADVSEWLNDVLESADAQPGKAFWQMQRLPSVSFWQLPFEHETIAATGFTPETHTTRITADERARILATAQAHGTSVANFILTCWQILLWRFGGQPDSVIGVRCDGRNYTELATALGPLARYVPLRTHLEAHHRFVDVMATVQTELLEIEEWQEYFSWDAIDPQQALLPVGFDYERLPAPTIAAGVSFALSRCYNCGERFKLRLSAIDTEDGLVVELHYDAALYTAEDIERLGHALEFLIGSAVDQPSSSIDALVILGPSARRQLLVEFNSTAASYPRDVCIHQLFQAQAARTPDAVAVAYETKDKGRRTMDESAPFVHRPSSFVVQLTYRELNRRANQLAHYLRRLGITGEVPVLLYTERSVDTIVGLLGILKAGGAYVPFDLTYPLERLAYIIEDTQAPLILTQQQLATGLPESWARIVCLDADRATIANESAENPTSSVTTENLAYVIYTSGSSGRPKGVGICHRSVVNLATGLERAIIGQHRARQRRISLNGPLTFDTSVKQIIQLLYGHTLCIIPDEIRFDPHALRPYIQKQALDVFDCTPAQLHLLIADGLLESNTPAPDSVLIGGEAIDQGLWKTLVQSTGRTFYNLYGPTECTVDATVCRIQAPSPTIGRPIANTQVYILDGRFQPVPIGVTGELSIGGVQLARGYLRRPDLTAERFVPNPFAITNDVETQNIASLPHSSRLYKTGDLARWQPGGTIDFLGRADHQVKLRGFRVELGEIEAVLSQHPAVRANAVIIREDTSEEKRLMAYIVPAETQNAERSTMNGPEWSSSAFIDQRSALAGDLRGFLQTKLPEYMVPAAFVVLDALPLTANGKIDRAALPAPGPARPDLRASYMAPRTTVEELLAAIWADVLGVKRIGIDDNFFALGGDSIRSVRVLALAQERGVTISLQQLFRHQTIRALAESLNIPEGRASAVPRIKPFDLICVEDRQKLPAGLEDAYPLTTLQVGMLYTMEIMPEHPIYHVVETCHLRASFELATFTAAVQQIVARQPLLRTAFDLTTYSEPLQLVHTTAVLPILYEDLRHLTFSEQERLIDAFAEHERHRRFDLSHPPLMQFAIHHRTDELFQFSITKSHIILDGWSLTSILAEIFETYIALLRGAVPPTLPSIPGSFRDFVHLERMVMQSEESQRYWAEQIQDCTVITLPRWPVPRRSGDNVRMRTLPVMITPEVSEGLWYLTRTLAVPLKSVLLAAHLKVMGLLSGQTDVLTGLVSDGRPEIIGSEQIHGLFLNTLPFRLKLPQGTWADLIRATFEQEWAMLPFRRYPVAELQKRRGRQPLFEVIFNYAHFYALEGLLRSGTLEIANYRAVAEETEYTLEALFFVDLLSFEVVLRLTYDSVLLSAEQVQAMCSYYANILTAMASDPFGRHDTRCFLTPEEQHQLLVDWNATMADYPRAACVHELFEAQAARTPDAVAVVFDFRDTETSRHGDKQTTYRTTNDRSAFSVRRSAFNAHLTYAELNARANQLAHQLQALHVGPDVVVGLCVERSLELLVGILGILKAGGAYLPLDPAYPQERLAFMIEDSQARVLITTGTETRRHGDTETRRHGDEELRSLLVSRVVIDLTADWSSVAQSSVANPPRRVQPEHLAYVIYTSGSTGRPKGVMVQQSSVLNLCYGLRAFFDDPAVQNTGLITSISFDISVNQIFPTLLFGRTLHVIPEAVKYDSPALVRYLAARRLHLLDGVPSYMQTVLADVAPARFATDLRYLLIGGEQLDQRLLAAVFDQLGRQVVVVNIYGLTEITDINAFAVIRAGDLRQPVTAGHPLQNNQIYITDHQLNLQPVGVIGEICIAGESLARGYLGRSDLTAERFVPNPFAEVSGAGYRVSGVGISDTRYPTPATRLYKTGDLGRRHPDGTIQILGRLDHQVKLRGFRIEIGEIETMLLEHPAVQEAAVVVREDTPGERRLVAYVMPQDADKETRRHGDKEDSYLRVSVSPGVMPHAPSLVSDLRAFLRSRLPDYMIPAALVVLAGLPKTPSGKLDRKALPTPDVRRAEPNVAVVVPQTPTEAELAALWASLLRVEWVGVYDNFFDLGGHSLTAMQLVAHVRAHFAVELTLYDLFSAPTIAHMAQVVEDAMLATADGAQLDQMLDMLEALDDDEAQRLSTSAPGFHE